MQDFLEQFLRARDGKLSLVDGWRWRHGNNFFGTTYHVSLVNFEDFTTETLQLLLLHAVKDTDATDLQIHFKNGPVQEVKRRMFEEILPSLGEKGFLPLSFNIKAPDQKMKWIRISLFSKECLPQETTVQTN